MPALYICEHQLELMLAAVEAYKPDKDEKEDHGFLLDYLRSRTGESAIWDEISLEDIPF